MLRRVKKMDSEASDVLEQVIIRCALKLGYNSLKSEQKESLSDGMGLACKTTLTHFSYSLCDYFIVESLWLTTCIIIMYA